MSLRNPGSEHRSRVRPGLEHAGGELDGSNSGGPPYEVRTGIALAEALKPAVRWEPSQFGFLEECPHRQRAATTFPSTITRLGPFSAAWMSIFGITGLTSPGPYEASVSSH